MNMLCSRLLAEYAAVTCQPLQYDMQQLLLLLSEHHAPALLRTPCSQAVWRAQIEIGQLDDTIGISEVPNGNLSYWFQGSSIVLSIQLNQGMFFQPIGVYVNKTSPPTGPPPSQQDSQASRMHPSRSNAALLEACKVPNSTW